jgi:hypothetical protein
VRVATLVSSGCLMLFLFGCGQGDAAGSKPVSQEESLKHIPNVAPRATGGPPPGTLGAGGNPQRGAPPGGYPAGYRSPGAPPGGYPGTR